MMVKIISAEKKQWTNPQGENKEFLVCQTNNGEASCWNQAIFLNILQAVTDKQEIDLNIKPNAKGKNQIYGITGQGGGFRKGQDKDWDKINAEQRAYKEREVDISQALTISSEIGMRTSPSDVIGQIELYAPKLIEIKRNLRKNYK